MKNLARVVFTLITVSLLAGCASNKGPAPAGLMRDKCVMSGEPLDAESPVVAYQGGKLGFCCDKCIAKWEKLDDAGKKAKLDATAPAAAPAKK